MRVNIPKRFESRAAIREFIQSRDFITAMKYSMNSQLFQCINSSNRILDLINAKLENLQKMHGGAQVGSNSKWKEFLRDGAVAQNNAHAQNDASGKTFKNKKSLIASSEDKRKSVPDVDRWLNKS